MTTNTQNIQAVAMIADKDDYRPALQSLYFTGGEAVATDGFILARTPCDISNQKRDAAPYQVIRGYSSINQDGSITIQNKMKDMPCTLEPEKIDAQYPRYEQILVANGQNKHLRIGLGVKVLEKLVKSLKKTNSDYIELQFTDDAMKPIYGIAGEVEYVIMPYKLSE